MKYNPFFNSVFKFSRRKSRRKRKCFYCGNTIPKGMHYKLHQFRYDIKIVSLYFHNICYSTFKYKNDEKRNQNNSI